MAQPSKSSRTLLGYCCSLVLSLNHFASHATPEGDTFASLATRNLRCSWTKGHMLWSTCKLQAAFCFGNKVLLRHSHTALLSSCPWWLPCSRGKIELLSQRPWGCQAKPPADLPADPSPGREMPNKSSRPNLSLNGKGITLDTSGKYLSQGHRDELTQRHGLLSVYHPPKAGAWASLLLHDK